MKFLPLLDLSPGSEGEYFLSESSGGEQFFLGTLIVIDITVIIAVVVKRAAYRGRKWIFFGRPMGKKINISDTKYFPRIFMALHLLLLNLSDFCLTPKTKSGDG